MKKVLSYILISLIISANLFAPFSVGWEENKMEIEKNEASAGLSDFDIDLQVSSTTTSNSINIDVTIVKGVGSMTIEASSTTTVSSEFYIKTVLLDSTGKEILKEDSKPLSTITVNNNILKFSFPDLQESAKYNVTTTLFRKITQSGNHIFGEGTTTGDVSLIKKGPIEISTIKNGETAVVKDQTGLNTKVSGSSDPSAMPACVFGSPLKGTFGGCMAQALYYMVFVPSSYLFAMSGIFFDSSFAYSVQDSSYRSAFVVQGWGLVRDFCNLFFIFIMLYIAIGTILNLSSVKTKETIINVVIIGLFINFSLFATQIIIDASNITARVFYNSNAIKITEKGVTGATNVVSKIGEGGVIPISAALVNKINPQNLILNAGKINDVSDTGGSSASDNSEQSKLDNNADFNSGNASFTAGTFALIVIMTSAVNIVGFTVFITVGFLFFARVIGLWLAMILAPLAFFTYILPELSSIKMIGWKNWWPETLKMAFLAPVFIFFMYLILKFLEMDLISDAQGKSGVAFFVAGMIPFVFIMIFMMKAKKIAVEMSGEFSEMVTKAGSAVGGMALGGAVGLGAVAMRGTIGRLGSSITSSDSIQQAAAKKGAWGMVNRALLSSGKMAGSGSFDVRNTKAGGMAGSGMGVDMGKAKEGGFVKARAEKTAARQQRAKDLELSVDSKPRQDLMRKEMLLKQMQGNSSDDMHEIDGKLEAARQRKNDAGVGTEAEKAAIKEIADLNKERGEINNGGLKKDGTYNTDNGKISERYVTSVLKSETDAKDKVTSANNKVSEAKAAISSDPGVVVAANKKAKADNDLVIANKALALDPQNINLSISAKNAKIAASDANTEHENAKSKAGSKVAEAEAQLKTAGDELAKASSKAAEALSVAANGYGKSINDLKIHEIPHDQFEIDQRNNRVKGEYSEYLGSGANKVANFFTSGGAHDYNGDFEAMYKIKMDAKIESTGGHGGGSSHTTPTPTPKPAAATPAPVAPAAPHP